MNYWILYNTSTGAIAGAPQLAASAPFTPGTGEAVLTLPQTNAAAAQCAQFPQWYLVQNGALVLQPVWTVSASAPAGGDSLHASTITLTATLANAPTPAPAEATFTILGSAFTAAVANGVATLVVNLHQACSTAQIQAAVDASGIVGGTCTFGGQTAVPGSALQCYQPASGNPTVAPVGDGSIRFLAGYYARVTVPVENQPGDTMTLLSMVIDLACLLADAAPPANATANQKNAIADLQALLAVLPVRLETAYPVGGSRSYPWQQAVTDSTAAAPAFEAFGVDLTTIPGLK